MSKELFIDVAVELPLNKLFTYRVPEAFYSQVMIGKRVLVPFRRRTITAYIVGLKKSSELKNVKEILECLDNEPLFDEERLGFFKWVSNYYLAPLGEVLGLTCPGNINKKGGMKVKLERFATPLKTDVDLLTIIKKTPLQAKILSYLINNGCTSLSILRKKFGGIDQPVKKLAKSGLIAITTKEIERDPCALIPGKTIPHEPNEEQRTAIDKIAAGIKSKRFAPFLLYGVTGSGKTLVYMKAIAETILNGRVVIFMVPEISLVTWPISYITQLFPGRVAVIHSSLSSGERYDQWLKIRNKQVDIVIGARSALFAPIKNPGLIIIDEEHETSYKQEEGVRYNARDSALMMGKFFGLTVVLGSATPSIETFYNSKIGKITPLYLTERAGKIPMPIIEMIDLKNSDKENKTTNTAISERLKRELEETLAADNQAMVFLNRRGFSNFLICKDCGHTFKCLNCTVSLTMHSRRRLLLCHYCDFSIPIPDICPICYGASLSDIGVGTEKIEEELRELFPKARIARMDRDTTRKKGSHSKIIDAMDRGDVDILIGTQMIAKGHHFPNVTLVGIVSGDTSLNIPDFRSAERTFQLITQASGRAGRGNETGKVVIQTYNPDGECLGWVRKHDYTGFFEDEITLRKEVCYPPFCRLVSIRVEGNNEERVTKAIMAMKTASDKMIKKEKLSGISILGPTPAFLFRLKGKFRWQMLIKGKNVHGLNRFIQKQKSLFEAKKQSSVNLIIDVDPLSTL